MEEDMARRQTSLAFGSDGQLLAVQILIIIKTIIIIIIIIIITIIIIIINVQKERNRVTKKSEYKVGIAESRI